MFWVTKFAKLGGSLKGAIKEFTKMNGRMPSSAEMNKMETIIKDAQSNVIPFPKQKSSLAELLRTGVVKRGVAPKTTPKDPIDQRWASQEEWAAKMRAENKAALKRFEEKFGKPEDRALGGRIGYAAGKIVKGASWIIKNLKRTYLELIEGKGPFANLNDLQRESYKWELLAQIKKLERGEPIPQELLTNMRTDKRFKDIVKTPSRDPELRELEEVLLEDKQSYLDYAEKQSKASDSLAKEFGYGEYAPSEIKKRQIETLKEFDVTGRKKNASGGLAGQLHLNQGGRARFQVGGIDPDYDIDSMRDPFAFESFIGGGFNYNPNESWEASQARQKQEAMNKRQQINQEFQDYLDKQGYQKYLSDRDIYQSAPNIMARENKLKAELNRLAAQDKDVAEDFGFANILNDPNYGKKIIGYTGPEQMTPVYRNLSPEELQEKLEGSLENIYNQYGIWNNQFRQDPLTSGQYSTLRGQLEALKKYGDVDPKYFERIDYMMPESFSNLEDIKRRLDPNYGRFDKYNPANRLNYEDIKFKQGYGLSGPSEFYKDILDKTQGLPSKYHGYAKTLMDKLRNPYEPTTQASTPVTQSQTGDASIAEQIAAQDRAAAIGDTSNLAQTAKLASDAIKLQQNKGLLSGNVQAKYHGTTPDAAKNILKQGFQAKAPSGGFNFTWADLFQKGPKAFVSNPNVAGTYGSKQIPVAASTQNLAAPGGGITSKGIKTGMETVLSPKQFDKGARLMEYAKTLKNSPTAQKLLSGAKLGLPAVKTALGRANLPLNVATTAFDVGMRLPAIQKYGTKLGEKIYDLTQRGVDPRMAGTLEQNKALFADPRMTQNQAVLPTSGYDTKANEKQAAIANILPDLNLARGGRVRFDNGGMSRRGFLKLMGGLAALPIVGKFFKLAKPAATAMKAVETSNAAGMPKWFPSLVNKVMKEGKDVTKDYATIERSVVKQAELPNSKTKVLVEQDLTTGNTTVDIGLGKHGWEDGRHGQPVRLTLQKGEWVQTPKGKKKAIKTKDEFDVEEAEFTGDAESVKYEDSVVEKYGDHASDFSEVEKYAVGKNVDKKIVGSKRARDDWAEGHAEAMAEQADEFAKGGLAGVLKL